MTIDLAYSVESVVLLSSINITDSEFGSPYLSVTIVKLSSLRASSAGLGLTIPITLFLKETLIPFEPYIARDAPLSYSLSCCFYREADCLALFFTVTAILMAAHTLLLS
ncbi:hypothetical protein AAHE18_01G251900 [Arachis hypogaea]